jgi:cell wall-associated NlpC family hydrolase
MSEEEQRRAVVWEALTWLGTPYQHMGRVKGQGVDCGMFLAEVFHGCGFIPKLAIEDYPEDWYLRRGEEFYLGWMKKYSKEVQREPLPGDVILYRYGGCISHGAIVIKWPAIIHAFGRAVELADGSQREVKKRQRAIFSLWE